MHLNQLYQYVKLRKFDKLKRGSALKLKNKDEKDRKFFDELRGITRSYSKTICSLINAYENNLDTFEGLKEFIEKRLIDKEGEVSPSKLQFLIKLNDEIKNKILLYTDDYPTKLTLVGRCELIRKDIKNFPKCLHCKTKPVSWHNSSFLHLFCGAKCSNDDNYTKEKREVTNFERFGSKCYLSSKVGIEKIKKTHLEKYGGSGFASPILSEKTKAKVLEKFGVDNNWKSKVSREKIKKTMNEKYGVDYYVQSEEFQKQAKASKLNSDKPNKQVYFVVTKKYKNTGLNYQGSFEFYFLELLEQNNLLHLVKRAKSMHYWHENEERLYYPDFEVDGSLIEIKSGWTYDKYGADKLQGLRNEAKWQAVRDLGKNIIVLLEKEGIEKYIAYLTSRYS